jgi:hypothetical protein
MKSNQPSTDYVPRGKGHVALSHSDLTRGKENATKTFRDGQKASDFALFCSYDDCMSFRTPSCVFLAFPHFFLCTSHLLSKKKRSDATRHNQNDEALFTISTDKGSVQ